jgi:hypothetical protein
MRWVGHVAGVDERRNIYRVLVGKTGGKRSLGRFRRRGDDNFTIVIKIDWEEVYWILLAQDRDRYRSLVNAAVKIPVP